MTAVQCCRKEGRFQTRPSSPSRKSDNRNEAKTRDLQPYSVMQSGQIHGLVYAIKTTFACIHSHTHSRFPERGYWWLGAPRHECAPAAPGSCEVSHWRLPAAVCTCSPCLKTSHHKPRQIPTSISETGIYVPACQTAQSKSCCFTTTK